MNEIDWLLASLLAIYAVAWVWGLGRAHIRAWRNAKKEEM